RTAHVRPNGGGVTGGRSLGTPFRNYGLIWLITCRLNQFSVAIAPPGQEGWLRHQEKSRAATLAAQTGWWFSEILFVTSPEPSLRASQMEIACLIFYKGLDRPPRLRRCCGFATFFNMAQPPLLARRGNCTTHSEK